MPGAMRKMGVYLGLVEDDDYGDGVLGRSRATSARRHAVTTTPRRATRARAATARTRTRRATPPRRWPTPVRSREYYARTRDGYAAPTPSYAGRTLPAYQITTLHPRTYNEARTIGEQFRKSTPVIMNLSEMDDADAKRLVDFAAGLTFGLHGRIERVTAKVFLLSPHNITVTAAGQGPDRRDRVLQPELTDPGPAVRGRDGLAPSTVPGRVVPRPQVAGTRTEHA